jgi:hypothetical protein
MGNERRVVTGVQLEEMGPVDYVVLEWPGGPRIRDLAELEEQGVLTEEEFAAQKARILGA